MRVSIVIGSPISATGFEIALDVDGQCLERRDVERVDAAMRRPGFRLRPRGSSIRDGRNPASVLPAPVGAISSADLPASALEQIDLMGARRPAALVEPLQEWLGQQGGGIVGLEAELARHASEVARRWSTAPNVNL